MTNLVQTLVNSIHNDLGEWKLGDGILTHRSGIRIWWTKGQRETKPQAGNMVIETSKGDPHLSRFVTIDEADAIWVAILQCKLAQDLVDDELLNRFKE